MKEKNRTSIIFKLNFKNNWYICNRHSDGFNNLLFPKSNPFIMNFSNFWNCEMNNPEYLLRFFTADNIKILQIINLENYNREDQKLINEIKRMYIDKYKLLDGQNLTDNCLNTELPKYRKQAMLQLKNITLNFYNTIVMVYNLKHYELQEEIKNILNELIKNNYITLHTNKIKISNEQQIPFDLINKFNQSQDNMKIQYIYDNKTNIYNPLVLGDLLSDDKLNQLYYFKYKKSASHISATKKLMDIPLAYILFDNYHEIKKIAWCLIRHYFNNNYNLDNNQDITKILYNDFINDKYLQNILN